jgi:hypothetical protein
MEKKSWDDIPSLEGLDMDWDYSPTTASNKRISVRMPAKSLAQLFESKEILARLAVEGQSYTGRVVDVSEGGMAVAMPVALAADLVVTVGFFLGQRKIIAKARIRHVRQTDEGFITGLALLQLDKENAEFIRELYAAQVLSHTI